MQAFLPNVLAAVALALCAAGAATPSAAQAQPKALVIGQSLPIGALNDVRGMRTQAGTLAYVEYLNANGGVNGRPVRLVTLEDGGDPARHLQNVRQLITEHKALAVLNCVGEASCQASATIAAELNVPLVGPITSAAARTGAAPNPWVFRVRPTMDREAGVLAAQLKAVGVGRVAIVTRDPSASPTLSTVRENLGKHGVEATVLALNAHKPGDLEALLKSLDQGRFHAAWLDLDYETVNWLVESGSDRREEWPRMLASTSTSALTGLLGSFRDRVIAFTSPVPNPEVFSLPLARDFQNQAESSGGGMAINDSGFEAYINARICIEALRRAGARPTPDRVAAALRGIGNLDLQGFQVSFARDRASASERVFVGMRARNGSIVR